MGHRNAKSALAKSVFSTQHRKIGPEMQKGIRGGVTPACAGVVGTADSPGPYGSTPPFGRGPLLRAEPADPAIAGRAAPTLALATLGCP